MTTSADAGGRPFRVLGLQQVAIGGPSKARLRTLWVDTLGLEVTGHFRSERENVDEDIFFSFRRSQHLSEGDYGRQISAIVVA